jgi:hypothetical protein
VYVAKCQPVEVVPRQHTECTNEIPVAFNDTEVFVDPISLVIKTAAAPVRCNDIAPPRWKLGGNGTAVSPPCGTVQSQRNYP